MKKITLLVIMSLLPLLGFAQFPENFDGAVFPPAGWVVTDNGVGTGQSWAGNTAFPRSAPRAAFCNSETITTGTLSQDWLISPLSTVPTNGQLRFWMRQLFTGAQGSTIKIAISQGPQTNLGLYNVIKTITDDTNPDNLNYYEHFADIPASFNGQQVYIAIIREFDKTPANALLSVGGDRILIDDLSLVQKCLDPTGLNAGPITTNQATLTWVNNSGSNPNQWDIELVNSTLGETPNFVTPDYPNITANNSFLVTGLLPDTNYNYYIRSRCSTGFNSEWIGPLNFSTRPLGSACATPLPITTLPYTHTSNTLLYSDTIDGASGCVTGNYLNGNEVIYQFTPDFTGNIILTMTPETSAIDTGVFIYNGSNCSNIAGGGCLAGVANNTNAVREITFAVTNGTPYYIVISSDGTPQTFGYTLVIQRLNCLPPNNLQFLSATQTSATFTWGVTGGATSWEYVIQAPGLGVPTGSGITVVPATNSVTDTTLNPSTPYEFYVRADCNDGTFSPWAGPIAFNTLCGAIPVPFTEGFNLASTTQFCWTVTSTSGANTWNMDYTLNPFEGNQSASILLNGATNDDWLISPQLILTGNQRLRFRYRTETAVNHNFEVKLSTAGIAPADFATTLVAQTNYNNTTYLEKIVNMNGVTGNVFIGWHVAPGANGARIYIDNVIVEDIPPCPNPLDIVVSSVGPNSATLNWTPGNTETSWQVAFVPTGDPAPATPTAGETAGTNINYTSTTVLNPVTTYDVYVLANCGVNGNSAWVGPVTFTTTQIPGTVPYVDGFEATPQWSVVNGTQTNKWTIGTAVNNGGANALYVTNDGGASNAYSIGSTSTVHVYRDITIPTGITNLNLAFDWRNEGEGAGAAANDYFSVWLVPTTFEPTPGTQITPLAGTRVKVGSNFSLNPAFLTQNITIPATAIPGPIWRLVFEWRNNGTLGNQPPAAIDNINLTVLTCPAPSNLSATAITASSGELNWNAGGAETLWDIVVQPLCSGTPTASSTIIENQTKPYTATSLTDGTSYEYYVRADCSGDNSHWVGPFVFNTLQVPATLNYTEGFENVSKWTFNNGTQVNKWIVGDAVNNGGTKSLYVSNTRCAENSNTYSLGSTSVVQAFRDFDVPAGVDLLSLSFDWRSVGETNDYLRVWIVPSTFTPNPGAQITAGSGRVNISGSLSGSATFRSQNYLVPSTAFAGQTMRLVFEWRNDATNGTQQPAAVDNINLSIVTCPPPTNLGVISTAATSAVLTWTPVGPATQWEVYAVPAGGSAPGPSTPGVRVNSVPAQITGLVPGTHYTYYVRSICSTTDVGPWTQTGFDFYTKPINDECSEATMVPVNTDIYCTQVAPGILAYATASAQPSGCAGADDDVWFQFVATNSYLTVALRDIVGVAPTAMTMSFYGGSCSGLTPIAGTPACVSNANAQTTLNGLVVGQTYYIRVFSNATTPQIVNFNVCITTPSTCSNSTSICTVQPYTYGNTTQVANLGTIGCLGTSPNPTFFTIQIAQSGRVEFEMVQTSTATGNGLDVDYAAWGPFTNQSLACANIPNASGSFAPPINLNPSGGSAQDYGCSYSALSVEQFIIPNAQAGEIYIVLITNFSNQPGTITLTQTNLNAPGSGQTLCCPSADFSYNPVQYCKGVSANPIATISTGSVAGTFSCISSNSADLVFANTATGEIDLAASQPGTYLIKNDTTGAAGTCAGREDYFTIVINAPQSAVISYPDSTPSTPGSEFCQSAGPQPVTVTGDQNGFFSLVGPNQIGLSIDTDTGQIDPSQSQPGTYTVNYYFLGSNNCSAAPITYDITIYPSPVLNPVVTQPTCAVQTGTVVFAANPNYEYSSDNGATYGTSSTFANLVPNTTYTFAVRDITNGCVSTLPIIINPLPTNPPAVVATPTAATCTADGAIFVNSPATGPRIYTDLFISEVYDKGTGSLSFIEIYNGTGAPVDLRNYKLRFYTVPATPTVPTANCDFALGVGANFMLANNATWVVKVSSDSVIGTGVIPNQNASLCAGVNVDDRIELTTLTNQLIDIWGVNNFVPFTPGGQPGYTYRRLNTTNAPSTSWNPLDWDAIDPENTTDIGLFAAQVYNYEYSIDGVTYQSSQQFNDVPFSPTPYTVIVRDPLTLCTSSVQVTITNPAPFAAPDLSLVSPASCNANPNATVAVNNPMGAGYDYFVNGTLYTGALNSISLPASATPYVISVIETATGCTTSASITINAPAVVTAPTLNIVAVATCANTQTATVEVSNPAGAGFTYSINGTVYTGALNAIPLAASATPYTIAVSDDVSGCSASSQITINAASIPAAPTFDLAATVQPTCSVPTGTIVVLTPAEGTGFEYAVNGGAYQASATFTGLAAGVAHTVTVRDLTTGCESLSSSLSLNAVPSAVTLIKSEGCNNGAYTLVIEPNDFDYEYEWTNTSGNVISTTNTAIVTAVGQYMVTVTTDEGCISTEMFNVVTTACDIPKGISPNNDNLNDSFNLSSLNVKKLSIFNRYGVVVYEHGEGYTNQWHGQSKGGDTLPDGTYYYVIESGDGQSRTGWVYINKER